DAQLPAGFVHGAMAPDQHAEGRAVEIRDVRHIEYDPVLGNPGQFLHGPFELLKLVSHRHGSGQRQDRDSRIERAAFTLEWHFPGKYSIGAQVAFAASAAASPISKRRILRRHSSIA